MALQDDNVALMKTISSTAVLALTTILLLAGSAKAEGKATRPDGFSVGFGTGIGIGYASNSLSLHVPTHASVRLRLNSMFTLEPRALVAFTERNPRFRVVDSGPTETLKELSGGLNLRIRIVQAGRLDFIGILGMNGGRDVSNRNGSFIRESVTEFNLVYGFATNYWVHPSWCFSLNAENSILQHTKFKDYVYPINKSTRVGPILALVANASVHLYF